MKNSQFATPLFEFSGACSGCGETPYVKLISQLFGDREMVANATGCSSIYSGSVPSTPYTTNEKGQGPAWANSLFEDFCEFGLGMELANEKMRARLVKVMNEAIAADCTPADVKELFAEWINNMLDADKTKELAAKIIPVVEANKDKCNHCKQIAELQQYLVKRSQWIIGGDGASYDIGYGGLDHVIATGKDVNILVLDTEVYSNTGGQSSKATPVGAIAKFAAAGKRVRKKDLGLMATTYGYVYVAQIAMGADQAQTLKAIREAEAYPGPSLIIAYAPCINHGLKAGMGKSQAEEEKAVKCGYWHLWRYNLYIKENAVLNYGIFFFLLCYELLLPFHRTDHSSATLQNTWQRQSNRLPDRMLLFYAYIDSLPYMYLHSLWHQLHFLPDRQVFHRIAYQHR